MNHPINQLLTILSVLMLANGITDRHAAAQTTLAGSSYNIPGEATTEIEPAMWMSPQAAVTPNAYPENVMIDQAVVPASGTSAALSGSSLRQENPALGNQLTPVGGSGSGAAATINPAMQSISTAGGESYLPNDAGQIWREYNIVPYTARVTSTKRPEQAIVNWILHETGWETWHGETLSILSATNRSLRVYQTPELQQQVEEIVRRFVRSEARTEAFGLRIVSVDHPSWRADKHQVLRPVQVLSPGTQAWLTEKESAARILADLQRRSDYHEHSTPHLLVENGQPAIVTKTRPRSYVRDIVMNQNVWPGYQNQEAMLDEGFALEFVPLLSLDEMFVEATIKLDVDQVEKLIPVVLQVPSETAQRQTQRIEVPQVSHLRFHEKFRWPVNQVLIVDLGSIVLPTPSDKGDLLKGLPLPTGNNGAGRRANVLIFVEHRGKYGSHDPAVAENWQQTPVYNQPGNTASNIASAASAAAPGAAGQPTATGMQPMPVAQPTTRPAYNTATRPRSEYNERGRLRY